MISKKRTFTCNQQELSLWLIAFLALCVTFSPLFFNFLWGNHDWNPILYSTPITSGLVEGRFSQYVIPTLLLSGQILPVLNLCLGFAFYSLALILLYNRFFEFRTTSFTPVIFLVVATLPYIVEITYFHFIVLSQLFWTFVITLALLCAKKANAEQKVLYTSLSTILLLFAIGGYPASVNLFVTATALWFIKNYVKEASFIKQLKRLIPFAISLFLSLLTLFIIYRWLLKNDLMMAMYNNQTSTLKNLILKIFPSFILILKSFIQPQPFFSINFKLITSTLFILFAINYTLASRTITQKGLSLLLLIALLFFLKFSALLINEDAKEYFHLKDPATFMVRTDFYSIPCLMLFIITYLSQTSKQSIKNITYILAALLLCLNLRADLLFTKTFLLGFSAENSLEQRIINRIKESPKYDSYNLYTLVQAGEFSLRSKYYTPSALEKFGYYTLETPFMRHWIPNEHYNFYENEIFVEEGRAINQKELTTEMIDFLANDNSVWPSPKSIYVDDRYSIVILTSDGQQQLQQQFKNLKDNKQW